LFSQPASCISFEVIAVAVLSLKSFHLVFVGVAIVFAAGFGIWGLLNYYPWSGTLSLIIGAILVLYGAYFAGRAERIHLR
jgi:membrane protein implicated in regulation of membrane protease activity